MLNNVHSNSKKERNINSVIGKYKLILKYLEDNSELSDSVINNISNQRNFALFSIKKKNILGMSLNTFKSIANEVLADESPSGEGFKYLDSLRGKLKRKAKKRKSSKNSSSGLIEQLNENIRHLDIANLIRNKAYMDLFTKVSKIVENANIDNLTRIRLYNILSEHKDLYGELMSPKSGNDNIKIVIDNEKQQK